MAATEEAIGALSAGLEARNYSLKLQATLILCRNEIGGDSMVVIVGQGEGSAVLGQCVARSHDPGKCRVLTRIRG